MHSSQLAVHPIGAFAENRGINPDDIKLCPWREG